MIDLLGFFGVDTVFGIPGVHTVGLYRGLSASSIRHITPRHELGAGFMADGYARMSGKPGVCLLITGPGLTNAISAMAQARADSIPLLIISGVNKAAHQGHEEGHLHELLDQIGLMRHVSKFSHCLLQGDDLEQVLRRAFTAMLTGRPGPVHLEIPLDVMSEVIDVQAMRPLGLSSRPPYPADLPLASPFAVKPSGRFFWQAEMLLRQNVNSLLGAPVVTTINARGLLSGHPLRVPASPSLPAVRKLLKDADLIIAAGTQFGPTDFDIYAGGSFPKLQQIVRIDIDPLQVTRGIRPDLTIIADAKLALAALIDLVQDMTPDPTAADRAIHARVAAYENLPDAYREGADLIAEIGTTVPN